ncbi:MAG: alpha-L-fucosidase [Armatimonadetes bacterium]|nr:alpha-L-fucosidase [Armatimonadota bacterium]
MLAPVLFATMALTHSSGPAPHHMDWFTHARLGMFIHWGPVSIKGTEIGWSRQDPIPAEEYDSLYKQFDPKKFDAGAWMKLAKEAGMRYVVPTAKHHDGFMLWPSKHDPFNYNISQSPFGRDIMGELAEAAKKNGIAMCTYYSILDWRSPDYPLDRLGHSKSNPNMERHMKVVAEQVSELIDRYGVKMIWFDGQWEAPYTRTYSVALNQMLRKKAPGLVINNRINSRDLQPGDPRGDYGTPEQEIGAYDTSKPWETCMTMGDQWAFRPGDHYKSAAKVIEVLIRTVTGDGNLLLNVGPMPNGEIPPEQITILKALGKWTSAHGESIYGTRGGPYKNAQWGGTTRKGKAIYFHVLDWGSGTIQLPPLPAKIRKVTVQAGVGKVTLENSAEHLTVTGEQSSGGPALIRVDIDRDAWGLGTLE